MKNILLTLTLGLILSQSQAQKSINFSGKIKNFNTADSIYLGLDGNVIMQLKLQANGTFSTNANIQQTPSFFYFAKISKKGKIEQQTPRIWFDKDSMEVNIDWLDKSFQIPNTLLYQSISEKIETLEGNRQTEFLLSNPISTPILYFINRNKENISISDLEIFAQRVEKSYQNTIYFKSIASYISAKKRKPIRIGDKVEDFKLTEKDGNQVSVINANENTKLITIFSSGCFYSISSIGLLEQLKKVNDNKIEIISIWADETKDAWLNAYIDQKNKITWTNVWDEYGFASTYFNNTSWPTFYVIRVCLKTLKASDINGINVKLSVKNA